MKLKLILFFVIFAFLLPLTPAHAAQKITPGTNCPKVGLTQTYGGKKFTCIKLGSKLYWDNGKNVSNLDALAKLPATCTISVPMWRALSEMRPSGQGGSTGAVYFSSLIVNSSISNVATNVRVIIEWYDSYGISFKKNYRIPKVYPGAMPFGFIEHFSADDKQYPTRPIDIRVSSTCSSTPIGKQELINGNFPIIKGQAPIEIRLEEPEDPILELIANLVLTNNLKRNIVFGNNDFSGNAQIFAFLKDSLGNVLGGFSSVLYGNHGEIQIDELFPGDTARLELQVDMIQPYDPAFIKRIAILDYVVILN